MGKCRKCGRLLKEGEKDLCPACRSEQKTKINNVFTTIVTTVGVVGVIILKTLLGKKTSNKA